MKIEIIHADGTRTVAQSPLDLQPGDILIIDGKISDMKDLIVGENQIIVTINGKPFIINNTDLFEDNVNDYDNLQDLLSDTSGTHTAIVFNEEDGIDSIVDDINGLADLMQTEAGEEDTPKSHEWHSEFAEHDEQLINVQATLRETGFKRDSDNVDEEHEGDENDNIFDTENGTQILGNEEGEKRKSTPDTHNEPDGKEQNQETTEPISENEEDQGSSETQESKDQEEEPIPENDDSESTQDSETTETTETTETVENHRPEIIIQDKNILTVDEDGDITFSKGDLLDNIYDADGDVLDIADIQTSVGEISKSSAGSDSIYTIHVPENYNGTIELTYKGTDGNLETQGKSLITVNEINDIPVVSIIDPTILEDESIQIPMDIQDVDGDDVTVSIFSNPSNGTAEILENGDILYTPVKDYNGPEEIILKISDEDSVTYKTVEVTVQPQNDEPTIEIVNDVTLYEDSESIISFDIQDIDGDNINFSVNEPEHGTIIVDGTQITYIPDHDYAGADSIVVNYSDGTVQKSSSVNVNVLQVNDEPIIEATNEVHMIEDSVQEIIFSASDIEDGENVEINVQSDNGIAIAQDGMIIYSPNADYNGTDTIIITVKDEDGAMTTKNINVQIDNDNTDIAYEIRTETRTETHTEIVEHTETRDIEVQHTRTIEVIDEEANTEAGITQNSEGQWVRTEEQTEVYTETVTEQKTRDVQETFTNTRVETEEYQEEHTRTVIDEDAMAEAGYSNDNGTYTKVIQEEFTDTRDVEETFTNTRTETEEFQNTRIVDDPDTIGVRNTDVVDSEAMEAKGYVHDENGWFKDVKETFTNTRTETEEYQEEHQREVIDQEAMEADGWELQDNGDYTKPVIEYYTDQRTETEEFQNTREVQVEFQDTREVQETFTNTRTETEEFQNTRIVDDPDTMGVRNTDVINSDAMEDSGYTLVEDTWTKTKTETFTNTRTETEEFQDTRDVTVEFQDTREVMVEVPSEDIVYETEEYIVDENIHEEEFTDTRDVTVEFQDTRDVEETFTNTRTETVQEEYQETHTRDSNKIDFDAMEDKGFVYVKDTSRVEVDELQLGTFDGKASMSDWGELKTESSGGFFGMKMFGGSTKETIEYNQDDISVKITNSDNDFGVYEKPDTSLGNGIGTADGGGISRDETMTFEIDGGTVNKAEFTLSGLGSWFDEGSSHATKVTLEATDIEGNELPAQGGYRENGEKSDTYTFESPIPIASITVGTEGGSGNFVVENLTLSSTDEIQIPAHWENANGETVTPSDDEIAYIQETYETTETRDVEVQVDFEDTRIVQEEFTNTKVIQEEFTNTRIVDDPDTMGVRNTDVVDVQAMTDLGYTEVQGVWAKMETEEFTNTKVVQEEFQNTREVQVQFEDTREIQVPVEDDQLIYETEEYIIDDNVYEETFTDTREIQVEFEDTRTVTEEFTNTRTETETFTDTREIQVNFENSREITVTADEDDLIMGTETYYTTEERDILVEFEDTRIIAVDAKPDQIIYETEEYVIDDNVYEETFTDTREVQVDFEDTRIVQEEFTNTRDVTVQAQDSDIIMKDETYETTETRDVQVEFQDTRIVQEEYTEDVQVQHERLVDVEVPAEPIMKEVQEDYTSTETEEYTVQEEVQIQEETEKLIMDLTDSEHDMDLGSIASLDTEKVHEINIDDNKLSNINMDDIMDLSTDDSLTFTGTNGGIIDLSSLPEGETVQKVGTVQVQDETFDTYSYSDSVGQELQMMIDTQIQVDL